MRLRVRMHLLVMLLALAAPTLARGQAGREHDSDSLPDLSWAPYYFPSFDGAARAAGLEPLRRVRPGAGGREVRIWTLTELGIPRQFYRFEDRGGSVTGELFLYWPVSAPDTTAGERPGETDHDLMLYTLRGSCDGFRVVGDTGICRARFTEPPPWGAVRRTAESHGLWTLPDETTFPLDSLTAGDGWTIVVELVDSTGYRTFLYNTPDAHPGWPVAVQVTEIARALRGIASRMVRSEVVRVYRGVTTGRAGSAFRSCGGDVEWGLDAGLASLARRAPPRARAALEESAADTTAREAPTFYVELLGELTPEWLARRWGSRFPRVLRVYELRDVRRWTGAECRRQ
ncbi:MAG TPA: hypothetical protein VF041_03220 [Gemmatimonadaceae bacterium]